MRKSGIIRILMVMAAAMILIIAGQTYAWEENTDRPGMDYKNFNLTAADPALCENACKGDATCKAWTYVKPNTIQGPQARCWLKNNVPSPKSNQCCVSGVKQLTMQVKPIEPSVIERVQIKPGPVELVKQCPDIKAMSIDFKFISMTGTNTGTVNIIGTAKNVGTKPNPVGGKLQLWMGTSLIGETVFGSVPAGGLVTIARQKTLSSSTPYPGDFVLKVVYDPYSDIPNKYDVDCDWYNNEIKRPISAAQTFGNPDLALSALTFKLIQKYSANSGKIEVKATAVNKGSGPVINKGWIQICEMESAKSYHCLEIARTEFAANVINPGQSIDVVQLRDFKGDCSNLLNSPRYKANIYYYLNPGQQQGKIYPETDANFFNNELEKDSKEVCSMLK